MTFSICLIRGYQRSALHYRHMAALQSLVGEVSLARHYESLASALEIRAIGEYNRIPSSRESV